MSASIYELIGGEAGVKSLVTRFYDLMDQDPAYAQLRPRIGVKRDEVLQLDGRTGLHPSLKPLMDLWQGRELADEPELREERAQPLGVAAVGPEAVLVERDRAVGRGAGGRRCRSRGAGSFPARHHDPR